MLEDCGIPIGYVFFRGFLHGYTSANGQLFSHICQNECTQEIRFKIKLSNGGEPGRFYLFQDNLLNNTDLHRLLKKEKAYWVGADGLTKSSLLTVGSYHSFL